MATYRLMQYQARFKVQGQPEDGQQAELVEKASPQTSEEEPAALTRGTQGTGRIPELQQKRATLENISDMEPELTTKGMWGAGSSPELQEKMATLESISDEEPEDPPRDSRVQVGVLSSRRR